MNVREVLPWNWSKKAQVVPAATETWSPFLSRDLDELLGDFGQRPFGALRALGPESAGYLPALDAKETDREIEISVELPGLSEKDIELTISHDQMTIKGEKQQEQTHGEDDNQWVERRFGSFRRVIPLPPDVAEEKVEASFEKGVLHIRIPRNA
ncbi:MAG: Hsp20/alpha crystallin family protein, partial [Planctomycetota bacterium]|nr:Hsp20/alpha crystallin family protein [Planctomycetota bacterium]